MSSLDDINEFSVSKNYSNNLGRNDSTSVAITQDGEEVHYSDGCQIRYCKRLLTSYSFSFIILSSLHLFATGLFKEALDPDEKATVRLSLNLTVIIGFLLMTYALCGFCLNCFGRLEWTRQRYIIMFNIIVSLLCFSRAFMSYATPKVETMDVQHQEDDAKS